MGRSPDPIAEILIMTERFLKPDTLLRTYILLREDLCSADRQHPLRGVFTVNLAEKLEKQLQMIQKENNVK